MRQVLAVALLDCRRLGFALVSAALVAGLIPSLASGLGAAFEPGDILMFAFMIVGAAAGDFFGADFAEGKSSFYFARPLKTASFVLGRFAALLALAAMAFAAFMASLWISSSDRSTWTLSVLTVRHLEGLGIGWSLTLYLRLAVAAHGRLQRSVLGWREMAKIPLRLAMIMGGFMVIFGLFADLIMRAYVGGAPVKVLLGSWIAAALVASVAAIAAGRTEGLRIARVQKLVVGAYGLLVAVGVITTWAWVLHPGPDAIETVRTVYGSPDGRYAYLETSVGRGDPGRFQPIFILDLASGQARRLDSDPVSGPWTSADGSTMVWGESTPVFFRPFLWLAGVGSNLRIKAGSGDAEELRVPQSEAVGQPGGLLSQFTSGIGWVLPSVDGSVLAFHGFDRITFMSRSGAELSRVPLGRGRRIRAAAFIENGALREAIVRQEGASSLVEFVEIDPRSGNSRTLASLPVQANTLVQMDARAERALVITGFLSHASSITLVRLTGDSSESSIVLGDGLAFPSASFLADGRIVAAIRAGANLSDSRTVRTFSSTGKLEREIPIGPWELPTVGSEVFPGIVGVALQRGAVHELALLDVTAGIFVRRLTGFRQTMAFQMINNTDLPSPPGSPGARLILSGAWPGGQLYDLPSVQAEPRLLMPRQGRGATRRM